MTTKEAAIALLETPQAFRTWIESLDPQTKLESPVPLEDFLIAKGFEYPSVAQSFVDVGNRKILVFGVNEHGLEEKGVDDVPGWIVDFVDVVWGIRWMYFLPQHVIQVLDLIDHDDLCEPAKKIAALLDHHLLGISERDKNGLPLSHVTICDRLSPEPEGNLVPKWALAHFCRLEVIEESRSPVSERSYYERESKDRLRLYDLAGFMLAYS